MAYTGGWVDGAVQTTTSDGNAKTIEEIKLAEGQALTIEAIITGTKDDYSASLGVVLSATFRRASGGNVTLVGAVQGTVQEDSASAPTATIAADTTEQAVDINVTGVASENWNWSVAYRYIVA